MVYGLFFITESVLVNTVLWHIFNFLSFSLVFYQQILILEQEKWDQGSVCCHLLCFCQVEHNLRWRNQLFLTWVTISIIQLKVVRARKLKRYQTGLKTDTKLPEALRPPQLHPTLQSQTTLMRQHNNTNTNRVESAYKDSWMWCDTSTYLPHLHRFLLQTAQRIRWLKETARGDSD